MKATFDNGIDNDNDNNEVEDLNINNEDILHLNDGGNLNCNIEDEHEQENQHNYFGGPILEVHQPNHHLGGHNKNNNINEEGDEVEELIEDSCVVIEDELSNNKNFDISDNYMPDYETKDEVDYEYTHETGDSEDDISFNDHTDDPMNHIQMPRMLKGLNSILLAYVAFI